MVFFFETKTTRETLVSVAVGNEKADIVIQNGSLAHTGVLVKSLTTCILLEVLAA